MPKIDITVEVTPLPEGWEGTPDELFEFFKNSTIFSFDGQVPTGQIGGAKPTDDSGIYYGDTSVEKFINGKYQPISDVPIGALFPWASGNSGMPDNYLLANGRSLLRADYPELFAAIGVVWGSESATTFTLPDLRGRHVRGTGIGDYKLQGIVGRMRELTTGSYMGFEWDTGGNFFPNAPRSSILVPANGFAHATIRYGDNINPSVAMPWIIRYR